MENQKSALGLDGNITALLGYIIGIVALVLVFIEKDNKFVRFHALQSVLFQLTAVVLWVALIILTTVVSMASGTLAMLFSLLFIVVGLGLFVAFILLAVKSFKGEMFKLPVLGDLAEKWV